MSDAIYKNVNFIMQSRGISARSVDDTLAQGFLINEGNAEELAENSVATRLGSSLINRTGNAVNVLPGKVHSLAKLAGIGGSNYRYAGEGADLYRRATLTQGAYTSIDSSLSGSPWTAAVMQPSGDYSALPFIFIADSDVMLKDNGTLSPPQNNGIFQPQYPVQAVILAPPVQVNLDTYTPPLPSDYAYTGIAGGSTQTLVNTTATFSSLGTAPGTVTVAVGDGTQVGQFQLLTVDYGSGSSEVCLVLSVQDTPGVGTTITIETTKTHTGTVPLVAGAVGITVPASTTASIAKSFGGNPIPSSETNVQNEADYIGIYLFVSDPSIVQSITLKFDCGDGSFNSDYFYKVIAQGPLQNLLLNTNDPTTAATDAILASSLNIYGNSPQSVGELNTGLDTWTGFLCQLSDFAGAGRASFTDPVFNWAAVNGYLVEVVTNDNGSANVYLGSLVLFGGAGPDTFAGVAYSYLFTFFNLVDGTESNPSMIPTNVNPPGLTYWAYPRRMPVQLTFQYPVLDPQSTMLRVYRSGGTLGDNYRRIDQIPITGTPQTYKDEYSDSQIQQGDIVSLTNDVPVTSSLPFPVNTTLTYSADPQFTNGLLQPFGLIVGSTAGMSVGQQVDIGNPGAVNFETVIVTKIQSGDVFLAVIQNHHDVGETVAATATYGQPCNIIASAYNQMWYAGDPNNPNYLYYSTPSYPQYVGSANYVPVSTPDDPITAIVPFKGNLYVSTIKGWWAIAPGTGASGQPTVYATAAKHGCVAVLGWCATEEAIFYQAIDGIRAFAGGASDYLTQQIEFIFQNVGSSPIVEADLSQLSQTRMAYWNMMVFCSYIGTDGNRHRVILHMVYKRWRNDDQDAQSMILEPETNSLVFGDTNGLIHLDRQIQFYDEGNSGGTLGQNPIPINIQTPYTDVGEPSIQKSWQELTLDIDTNGQTLNVYLWFEDGEYSFLIGTVNNSERQKVNFALNNSNGYEYYKVSIQVTGSVSAAIYLYQASIKYLPLAKTRKTMDTFWLKFGTDDSKICKDLFIEYTATAAVTANVYYDDFSTAGFTFTLPANGGVRNALRVRLPAVSFRLFRLILSCSTDFQVWEDSMATVKNLCVGRAYELMPFVPNG